MIGRERRGVGNEGATVDDGAAGVGIGRGDGKCTSPLLGDGAIAGNHAAKRAGSRLVEDKGTAVGEYDISVGWQIRTARDERTSRDRGTACVGIGPGEGHRGGGNVERCRRRPIGDVAIDGGRRGTQRGAQHRDETGSAGSDDTRAADEDIAGIATRGLSHATGGGFHRHNRA